MYSIIFQASPIFQSSDTLINKKVVHLIKTNGGSNLDIKQSGAKTGRDTDTHQEKQTKPKLQRNKPKPQDVFFSGKGQKLSQVRNKRKIFSCLEPTLLSMHPCQWWLGPRLSDKLHPDCCLLAQEEDDFMPSESEASQRNFYCTQSNKSAQCT